MLCQYHLLFLQSYHVYMEARDHHQLEFFPFILKPKTTALVLTILKVGSGESI